jgi:hypothetical protein
MERQRVHVRYDRLEVDTLARCSAKEDRAEPCTKNASNLGGIASMGMQLKSQDLLLTDDANPRTLTPAESKPELPAVVQNT